MDFITTYGLVIWITLTFFCLVVGMFLTLIERRKQRRHTSRSRDQVRTQDGSLFHHFPRQHHMLLHICPTCTEQVDDPSARFCWFCGYALEVSTTLKKPPSRRWTSGTRLVELDRL